MQVVANAGAVSCLGGQETLVSVLLKLAFQCPSRHGVCTLPVLLVDALSVTLSQVCSKPDHRLSILLLFLLIPRLPAPGELWRGAQSSKDDVKKHPHVTFVRVWHLVWPSSCLCWSRPHHWPRHQSEVVCFAC